MVPRLCVPTMITGMESFIYLASQSPRRRQLLQQIGTRFEVLLPEDANAAEALEAVHPGEAPTAYARRVTRLKLCDALARRVRRGLPVAPVLCSDTTVALGGHILGKPRDAVDAAHMLRQLSGRTHRVITAVAVQAAPDSALLEACSTSRVRFAILDERTLADYIDSGEWSGKAGAYGIQGLAATFIEHISGSYTGIMGLPLFETAALLRRVWTQP